MALSLIWDPAQAIWTAKKGKIFTTELRSKKAAVETISATYKGVVVTEAPFSHTAVSESQTLVHVYEATVPKVRIELWEIDGAGGEQMLTFIMHKPHLPVVTLQIN